MRALKNSVILWLAMTLAFACTQRSKNTESNKTMGHRTSRMPPITRRQERASAKSVGSQSNDLDQRIKFKIGTVWRRLMDEIDELTPCETVVKFTYEPNGSVSNLVIVKSDCGEKLDKLCLQAVKTADLKDIPASNAAPHEITVRFSQLVEDTKP